MTAKTISRKMALATVLLMVGVAGSECGRAGERLTAPAAPILSLSSPTLSSNYAWQVAFTGDSSSTPCEFDWSWQLADGSTMAGGATACVSPSSGTGSIPPGATGVVVNGRLIEYGTECNTDSKSATKSFDGSGSISITMNLSVSGSFRVIVPFGNTRHMTCPSANATFTLKTT